VNYLNLITNRLELIPLSIIEFDYLLNNLTLFEKNLSIKYEGEDFQNALHHIFSKQLDLMITHPHDSIFFALWVIKKQVNQVIIGSLCFKDVPNKNGEIEIGYGINPRHQNMGFMTEAVNALCQFGYTLPGVHQIIAKTSRKNIASQKVLLKNHFILSDSSGDEYCYTHQK
jgi:RimJ/RimL family protein N-acetyltransferase